ncbi:uncharacterized protein LOC143035646 [Oratosquilla oratoria]|uniref:uncharacterized protein LOC143035646 n=1 Tax=Oratosquilla oratoria TaxID=337810 RepID=UPI003F76F965
MLAAAKQTAELERLGICQKAPSPWLPPLHIVTKKNGFFHPCGDYRRLNTKTEPDHYPLPNITDITSFLHGAKIFSKLDLKGHYQVPMHPEDIPNTAVTTPFGTFTFNYSCVGLRNFGDTLQRMMDGIQGDLPFCTCYADDVLIFNLKKNGLVVSYDKDAWSARQRRHLTAIVEFNCTFRHLPGKKKKKSSRLSRVKIDSVQLGLDYDYLAKEQQRALEGPTVRTSLTVLQWKGVPLSDSSNTILCDVSTGRPRPWIPLSLRRHVFGLVHDLSHPSRRATARLISQKFVWHDISLDARNCIRFYTFCQKSKVLGHKETGPGSFHQPQRRFIHIHVDVVGPLPPLAGHCYLFTIINRSTRCPEAILNARRQFHLLHSSPALRMDFQIRHPRTHHVRPRNCLHVAVMDIPGTAAGQLSPPQPTTRRLTAWNSSTEPSRRP